MDDLTPTKDTPSSGDSAPAGIERRMVFRLISYWRGLPAGGAFPRMGDVSPDKIPDIWPHCYVLDISHSAVEPEFLRIGDEFALHATKDLVGLRIADIPDNTLAKSAISYLPQVLRKQVPISRGGELIRDDGAKILYRSIILPMSHDGTTLDALLGAANCRVVTE